MKKTGNRRQANRRWAFLIAAFAVTGALAGGIQALSAAPAAAFHIECFEAAECVEDSDGGGVAEDGGAGGGEDPAGGASDATCADYSSSACWGDGGTGSSTPTGSTSTNGVDPNDPCAGWGVSCDTGSPKDESKSDEPPDSSEPEPAHDAQSPVPPMPPDPCKAQNDALMRVMSRTWGQPDHVETTAEAQAYRAWEVCISDTQRSTILGELSEPRDRTTRPARRRARHRRLAQR